jgi:hypothetical protein
MSKFKDFINDIVEMHQDGISINAIANNTGLPMDVVFDILKNCNFEDATIH